MVDVAFAIPGDLNTPTGGYAYDREILARLPALGIRARHLQLAGQRHEIVAGRAEAVAQHHVELGALVAFGLQHHHVSRYQVSCFDPQTMAITNNCRMWGQHILDSIKGFFCFSFLNKADQSI